MMRKIAILLSLSVLMLLTVSGMALAADEEAICREVGGEWTSGLYRCTFFVFGENSHGIEYSYQYRYPTRIVSEPFIQTAISDYLQGIVDEFMAGVEMTADAPGALFLETEHEIFYHGANIRSVAFFTSTYMGGASPFLLANAMTFNTETDQVLALDDLFVEGADYMTPIKAAVQADLVGQLGEDLRDFIEAGTSDDAAFHNFAISDDALIFFFSEGDVAPNAAGPRSAEVLLSDLGSIWALDVVAGPAQ